MMTKPIDTDVLNDAVRFRKLLALAQKKTAHDLYGDGCAWSINIYSDDGSLSLEEVDKNLGMQKHT